MLRFHNYDIVFQEVPGEVTLAFNLTNCPNRCAGCHSPHLTEDTGEVLDERILSGLLEKYGSSITCVCFMGGDAAPHEVAQLSVFLRETTQSRLKTAWYSGKQQLPENIPAHHFDYIKLGPYIEHLGGLDNADTNQRFYRVEQNIMIDTTRESFQKQTRPTTAPSQEPYNIVV